MRGRVWSWRSHLELGDERHQCYESQRQRNCNKPAEFEERIVMPIYEYPCGACDHRLEKIQKMSDDPLKDCPSCLEPTLSKLVSAAAFRLKGDGWYETDFKTGKKKNVLHGADSNKSDSKSDDSGSDSAKSSGDSSSSTSSNDKGATSGKQTSSSSSSAAS